MPAALKFANFTFLHPHKPYKFLKDFSSSSSSATTAVESKPFLRLKYSSDWWRRTIPYATAAPRKITSQIFGGQKSDPFSSGFRNRGLEGKFLCNSETNLGAKMCDTVNNKVENHSDVSPSPSQDHHEKQSTQQSKLLTLPTMLTIGRVAAVPLLVGSMCLTFVFIDILVFIGFSSFSLPSGLTWIRSVDGWYWIILSIILCTYAWGFYVSDYIRLSRIPWSLPNFWL